MIEIVKGKLDYRCCLPVLLPAPVGALPTTRHGSELLEQPRGFGYVGYYGAWMLAIDVIIHEFFLLINLVGTS